MALPKISVITVSFNARECIGATVDSVLAQTYPGVEYIVIDGGSTDGTAELVSAYGDRIAHFVSERDGGIYFGMNKGIDAATGDFAIFMNSGDVFADERVLEDVAAFLEAHPEAQAVYGNSLNVYEYGSYLVKPAAVLGKSMGLCHQATFVALDLLRGHKFDTQYRYAADFEQLSALHEGGAEFVYFDRTVARVEMRGGATFSHFEESAEEMYGILAARGADVARVRRSQLRRKRLIHCFKTRFPRFLTTPILRLLAKVYKPL